MPAPPPPPNPPWLPEGLPEQSTASPSGEQEIPKADSPEKADRPPESPLRIPDIIPGILPAHQVHILSGASGAGKTALVAWLFAQIADGADSLFGAACNQPSFLGVIAADRTWQDHQQWYTAAGFPGVAHYSLVDDLEADRRKLLLGRINRFDLFCSCLDKLAPTRGALVAVDPATLFIGGDPNDYDRVYRHMLALNQLCLEHGITLLLQLHAGKQKADPKARYARPQDRVLGSTAQTGCAGTTFHLATPEENEGASWSELTWVPHHAPAQTIRLERDKATGLLLPMSSERVREVDPLFKVLEVLPEDGSFLSFRVVYLTVGQKHGLSRRATANYLGKLRDQGRVQPNGKGRWGRIRVN